MEEQVELTYQQFKTVVSDGREMEMDKVEVAEDESGRELPLRRSDWLMKQVVSTTPFHTPPRSGVMEHPKLQLVQ